jgi:hypothetical protein
MRLGVESEINPFDKAVLWDLLRKKMPWRLTYH